jgi:plasmid stability protein
MVAELPPSIKVLLKVEAARRGTSPEELLNDILMGKNPLPKHLSDLIRAAWKAERGWSGVAE